VHVSERLSDDGVHSHSSKDTTSTCHDAIRDDVSKFESLANATVAIYNINIEFKSHFQQISTFQSHSSGCIASSLASVAADGTNARDSRLASTFREIR